MTSKLPPLPPKFLCELCECTFTRKDNMIRHMIRKHNIIETQNTSNLTQNSSNITQNSSNLTQISSNRTQITSNLKQQEENDSMINNKHTCSKCNTVFSRKWCLDRHTHKCNGTKNEYTCNYCEKEFTCKTSRFRHYKICKVKKEKDATALVSVDSTSKVITNDNDPSSINSQTAEVINNIGGNQTNTQNNIINILTFPQPGDTNFDFICDQITKATMKGLLQSSNTSQVGFNKFINKVMENPQNRIVHKTNPNCTYSKVHVGDGKWELAHDDDVFPILTHHMTTAALGKVQEVNKDIELVRELYNKLDQFRNHVVNINEMDYESEPYKGVLQRIKLIIVNLTRRWFEENGEELK